MVVYLKILHHLFINNSIRVCVTFVPSVQLVRKDLGKNIPTAIMLTERWRHLSPSLYISLIIVITELLK